MQKLVKTCKNTEVNIQSDVKFWIDRINFVAVLLSCKKSFIRNPHFKCLVSTTVQVRLSGTKELKDFVQQALPSLK